MKKSFILFISLLLVSVSGFAKPKIYTLEGSVAGLYGDSDAIFKSGMGFGDYVKYVILIDKDRKGFTDTEGNISYVEDTISDNETWINYYAELIEASYSILSTYYNWKTINYYAVDVDASYFPDGPFTRIHVGQTQLYIDSSEYLDQMVEGGELAGSYLWHDSESGEFARMSVNLVITKIEEPESESEPSNTDNIQSSNTKNGGLISYISLIGFFILLVRRRA